MKVTEAQKKEATEKGTIKISSGVYLATADYMISEQRAWEDEDVSKRVDFSVSAFWITTDDGQVKAL